MKEKPTVIKREVLFQEDNAGQGPHIFGGVSIWTNTLPEWRRAEGAQMKTGRAAPRPLRADGYLPSRPLSKTGAFRKK